MGCDIHMYLETKPKLNGKWRLKKEIDIGRNYILFGLLAGVRYDLLPPISESRGLPYDLSKELRRSLNEDISSDDLDGPWLGDHSFSYLDLADFQEYEEWECVEDENEYGVQDVVKDIVYELVSNQYSRIVFGFDS